MDPDSLTTASRCLIHGDSAPVASQPRIFVPPRKITPLSARTFVHTRMLAESAALDSNPQQRSVGSQLKRHAQKIGPGAD